MPGSINGITLAAKVHGNRPEAGLIVTSAATTIKDPDLPDDGTFIAEPYRTTRLIQVVSNKLENHEGRDETSSSMRTMPMPW